MFPSLLDLPDETLTLIFEYTDYKDVFRARRVCKSLKTFIDVTKPALHIQQLEVWVCEHGEIEMKLNRKTTHARSHVTYQEAENGKCRVLIYQFGAASLGKWRQKEGDHTMRHLKIKNQYEEPTLTKMATFQNHLGKLLDSQKSPMNKLKVYFKPGQDEIFNGILEFLSGKLRARRHALRVENLEISVQDEHQIMQILPYLDSKFVKRLKMIPAICRGSNNIQLASVAQLDQWKSLETLEMSKGFYISGVPMNALNFGHFSNGEVTIKHVDATDIILLQKCFVANFARSRRFSQNSFRIHCETIRNERILFDAYGPKQKSFDGLKNGWGIANCWFFRVSDDDLMEMIQYEKSLHFLKTIRSRYGWDTELRIQK